MFEDINKGLTNFRDRWKNRREKPGHQEGLSTKKHTGDAYLSEAEVAFKNADAKEAVEKAEALKKANEEEAVKKTENLVELRKKLDKMPGSPEMEAEKQAKLDYDAQREQLEITYVPKTKIWYQTAESEQMKKNEWINMEVVGASFDKVPGLVLKQENGRTFAISGNSIEGRISKERPAEMDGEPLEKAA